MKRLLTAILSGGVLVAGTVPKAETAPKADDKSRVVQVSEKTVTPVRVAVLEATLFVLPKGERVATAFTGDTAAWQTQATKVPTRYLSIKPVRPHVQTNLHIITDHGNEYTFLLTEVTGSTEPYDVKIFIESTDAKIEANIEAPPVMVSADEAARAKQDADQAKKEAVESVKAAQAKSTAEIDAYRESYPARMAFNYWWDRAKGDKFGLQQIWSDDKFTYFRARPNEAPALYEVKEGKPSLVNFSLKDGLYTVEKLVDNGYLAVGKVVCDFRKVSR